MNRTTIYWTLPNTTVVHRLQECLGVPQELMLNGEQYVEVTDLQRELIKQYERNGLLQIRAHVLVKINNKIQPFTPGMLAKLTRNTYDNMNEFELIIKAHLDQKAEKDSVFAEKYNTGLQNGKTIETCCNFITAEVKKTKRTAFTDDEIYGIAIHYYDESSINPCTTKSNATVVTPRVELTEQELQEAKRQAFDAARESELQRIRERKQNQQRQKNVQPSEELPSLFD